MRHVRPIALAVLILAIPMTTFADEGMWLLNDPPRERLQQRYQFDLTDAWLKKAQLAAVRFNNGGSGGFVSPYGLVVTNHHIGADSLQKLSNSQRDLLREGFLAPSQAEELKCPDLELNVLQSIEDVTARVNAAIPSGLSADKAFAARRAVMSEIEKESLDKTGLRSDVVTLYNGGLYHLYRYKKHTDVRLVFAPEAIAAAFGGDVDNFEYPRHGLDVCFVRVYEDNQPLKSPVYFPWNAQGPAENDLVFVLGHPGTTNRLETLAKLEHRRDFTLPYQLTKLRAMEAALIQFGESDPEFRRQAATDLHRYANSRKASAGMYEGLFNSAVMKRKVDEENDLIQFVLPGNTGGLPEPWHKIAKAQEAFRTFEKEYSLLERADAFATELFTIARHLVRLSAELPKPSAERIRDYRETALDSLRLQIHSPAPIMPDLERAKLTASLTLMAEQLGGTHPMVVKILNGKPPSVRAAELVRGTKLFDVAERKKIEANVQSSADPMIALASMVDMESRRLRHRYETEVEEVERQAYAAIANARFKKLGRSIAPDATFTLRIAFGQVKGYDDDGRSAPFATTIGGAFDRSEHMGKWPPFELPRRWWSARGSLNLKTPYNFASTADTIGGNSGSPVLNRAGELVGVNFDRNRFGLVRNFVYTDVKARHISVHSAAVLEALTKIYRAPGLVQELAGAR